MHTYIIVLSWRDKYQKLIASNLGTNRALTEKSLEIYCTPTISLKSTVRVLL